MKIIKFLFFFLALSAPFTGVAQQHLSPDVQKMQQSAHQYLQERDYANSIMLLNQAIRQAPDNVSLRRDLAYTYFLSGKAEKARAVIQPVVQSDFADEQTFQVAAAIENVLGKYGRAKRLLKEGIRKFPHSGLLYNNLGNLYSAKKSDQSALAAWMKGIKVSPGYALNYYGAARMFQLKKKYVWALLYGEIFLNLDAAHPSMQNEIKKMMLASYKAVLSGGAENGQLPEFRADAAAGNQKPTFENCFRKALLDNVVVVRNGINAETLTMLRTRFLMEWELKYANKFPFTLLSWENKLIHAGFYDAYNQWLFGAVSDSRAFRLWTTKFADNYAAFQKWRQRNPLQPADFDPKPGN